MNKGVFYYDNNNQPRRNSQQRNKGNNGRSKGRINYKEQTNRLDMTNSISGKQTFSSTNDSTLPYNRDYNSTDIASPYQDDSPMYADSFNSHSISNASNYNPNSNKDWNASYMNSRNARNPMAMNQPPVSDNQYYSSYHDPRDRESHWPMNSNSQSPSSYSPPWQSSQYEQSKYSNSNSNSNLYSSHMPHSSLYPPVSQSNSISNRSYPSTCSDYELSPPDSSYYQSSWRHQPSYPDPDYSNSMYDLNDVTHSFYGLEDQFGLWNTGDEDMWMNPPAPSRNLFGFSDNMYLDPLDCEGISYFNNFNGIHAPRPINRTNETVSMESTRLKPMEKEKKKEKPIYHKQHYSSSSSYSSTSSKQHSSILTSSSIPPPVHLSHLWIDSDYRTIWNQFDITKKQHLQSLTTIELASSNDIIRKRIEQGIQEKKACHITRARSIFVELAVEFCSNVQVWLEFCRLEMECGDYKKARRVLETACSQHPHNELLLQKRLRVEERLRSVNNVIMIINELHFMDTQKSMKIMIEGISVLAKLGYEKMAFEYAQSISPESKNFTGNLYLEIMLIEQRAGSLQRLLILIKKAVELFPKYGPLWFFCFNLQENIRLQQWNRDKMSNLLQADDLDAMAESARGNLTADILWKVFLVRVEFWYRCTMYLREETFDMPYRLKELISNEYIISSHISTNLKATILSCPPSLQWKLYITIARYVNLLGFRHLAQKAIQRSYRLVPVKSRHAVLLEYSKIEYFALHHHNSAGLLNYGIECFPAEWKLLLERIQQLILKEHYFEALQLNIIALTKHIGAGRLWSSYIHIMSQVFGPDAAMKAFHTALKHVAKSGEVWCEGARIYMNPTSSHFHLMNAAKCLNYAVFFTPQYGDSFIEAIRLYILSSDIFLLSKTINSRYNCAILYRSLPELTFLIKRASYFEPNYGPLWFRCQESMLSPPKEVLYRSLHITVLDIAINKNLYYEAILKSCIKHHKNQSLHYAVCQEPISLFRKQFAYSFKPDYQLNVSNHSKKLIQQAKILYGASQLDN